MEFKRKHPILFVEIILGILFILCMAISTFIDDLNEDLSIIFSDLLPFILIFIMIFYAFVRLCSSINRKLSSDIANKIQETIVIPEKKPTDINELLNYVKCDYNIIENNINRNDLTKLYLNELENGKRFGYTPLIIVLNDHLIDSLGIALDEYTNLEEYRKNLLGKPLLNGKNILDANIKNKISNFYDFNGDDADLYGNFNSELTPIELLMDAHKNSDVLAMLKIPTLNPWEIFAWFPIQFGDESGSPEEMMAISKYWYEKYGAIPSLVRFDEIQMIINNPVTNLDEALALAQEQYGYCPDIVEQGCNHIKELASILVNSKVWYFWWD